jgi:hypothetical protein
MNAVRSALSYIALARYRQPMPVQILALFVRKLGLEAELDFVPLNSVPCVPNNKGGIR